MNEPINKIEPARCFISIIVCTHNRSALLRDALESFAAQSGLEGVDYEMILVDNASTDDTVKVAKDYEPYIALKYIHESTLGLSYARNKGVDESRGEVLAFADDDVIFSTRWLVELVDGISRWPKASIFGGKALAKWEIVKPKWFVDSGPFSMRGIIAHFEPNIIEGYMDNFPYGCNMVVKKVVFERIGNFNVRLGRKGKKLLSGEEFDFFNRAKKNNFLTVYLPNVSVQHRVLGKRNKISYYINWKYNSNKSLVVISILHTPNRKKVLFIRIRGLRVLARTICNIFSDVFIHKEANVCAYLVTLVGSISYAFYYITTPLTRNFKQEFMDNDTKPAVKPT